VGEGGEQPEATKDFSGANKASEGDGRSGQEEAREGEE
jgi:hypothetical protein